MRLSEYLTEALASDDMSKSLNSLIKYNNGEWKSDRQAKYLLVQMRDRHQTPDALKWARRQKFFSKGMVVVPVVTTIQGYGRQDPTKIRYSAQVFVLDGSGVVARYKFKYKHYSAKNKASQGIDWSSGKTTYERKEAPGKQYVDLEQEDAKKARKEAADKKVADKQIALIRRIPDWTEKKILVDFMGRLEDGWPLTPNQLAVVQGMSPDDIFVGDKKQWIKTYDEFKTLVTNKVLTPWRELENHRVQADREAWAKATDDDKRYMQVTEPSSGGLDGVDDLIAGMKSQGYSTGSNTWIDDWVLHILGELAEPRQPFKILNDAYNFQELRNQYDKAIKAKRPTKKAIRVITFIAKVVDKLKNKSADSMKRMIIKAHGYEEPTKQPSKPSQQLNKAIGYTVPSPSKFGF